MTEYVTTNVRLPKELYRQAKRRALEEEKSLAEVIRESVIQYLTADESTARQMTDAKHVESDPLWLIGTDPVESDVTDASINHDRYLYGSPPADADGKSAS
jgi:hypothetical protein